MTKEIKNRLEQIRAGKVPEGYKKTKAGIIPEDWEQHKLGEIADFGKGQGYTKSDLKEDGTPIILYGRLYTKYQTIIKEVDTFADVVSGAVFSKGGEVILPASGETAEDIAIAASVDRPGILLGGGLNVVFPHEEIKSSFLAMEISFGPPHKNLAKRAQGKSIVHLYNEDLKEAVISYPPIEEQMKITTMFADLDNLVTLHQCKLEEIRKLKRACLSKMFPKNGSNIPEIRFPGFTAPWEQRKLEKIASLITKGTTPIDKSGTGSVNFVKIESIDSSSGEITITSKISEDEHNGYLRRSQLQENDILFSIAGTLGRVTAVNKAILPANTNQALAIIRLKSECLLYIISYLKGKAVADFIKRNPTVGAQPNLSLEQVGNLNIALPSIAEQQQIGAFFKQLDHLITLHQRKIEEIKKLKKALMQLLLTGIVRV